MQLLVTFCPIIDLPTGHFISPAPGWEGLTEANILYNVTADLWILKLQMLCQEANEDLATLIHDTAMQCARQECRVRDYPATLVLARQIGNAERMRYSLVPIDIVDRFAASQRRLDDDFERRGRGRGDDVWCAEAVLPFKDGRVSPYDDCESVYP